MDWKYKNRLETRNYNGKSKMRFETKKVDWFESFVIGNIASNVEYTIMTESKRSFDLEYAIYQCIRAFDFESLRSFRLK